MVSEEEVAVAQAQAVINENCNDEILKMDTSDGGNADAFAVEYSDDFIYVRELGWLRYNGAYWQHDDGAVMLTMRKSIEDRHVRLWKCGDNKASELKRNTYKINAAIEQAQAMLERSIDEFDKDPDTINVANGVLHLDTGKLDAHNRDQLFTYALNAPYDASADMSMIENFMATVLTKEGEETNQELVDFMQTALGYSMTGHTREEKLFYLFGSLGRNGKGSITETMMALVAYPIAQEVDFNTFVAKRDGSSQNFDLADMKASRLLFASESNKYQQLNPASIKKLTGGNYVRAAHKYKDFFAYRPQYKVWLSSNHNVNGDPDDNAMWNRVGILELPNSYIDVENKGLKTSLRSPDGLKGLLRWLVIGSMRWYASEDGLVIPEQVKLATRNQRDSLDTFSVWLEDMAEEDEEAFTPVASLTQNYKTWCEVNGVTPKARNQFADSMLKHEYTSARSSDASRVRGYVAIG